MSQFMPHGCGQGVIITCTQQFFRQYYQWIENADRSRSRQRIGTEQSDPLHAKFDLALIDDVAQIAFRLKFDRAFPCRASLDCCADKSCTSVADKEQINRQKS